MYFREQLSFFQGAILVIFFVSECIVSKDKALSKEGSNIKLARGSRTAPSVPPPETVAGRLKAQRFHSGQRAEQPKAKLDPRVGSQVPPFFVHPFFLFFALSAPPFPTQFSSSKSPLSGTSDLLFLVEERQPAGAGFWGRFWTRSPHRKKRKILFFWRAKKGEKWLHEWTHESLHEC